MSPAEQMIAAVPMTPCPKATTTTDLPFVTHEGAIEFEGHRLRVYQLSNGVRVIDADDVEQMFAGITETGDADAN